MFTARYGQIPYITHTCFVFKRLIVSTHERNNKPQRKIIKDTSPIPSRKPFARVACAHCGRGLNAHISQVSV